MLTLPRMRHSALWQQPCGGASCKTVFRWQIPAVVLPMGLNFGGFYNLLAPWSQHQHSVQFSSVAQSCPTLCDPRNCSTPGLPVHHQLLEFTQLTSMESVMPSSHLILCRPLLLLPPIPPTNITPSSNILSHMNLLIASQTLCWTQLLHDTVYRNRFV